ncbi:MAG TPA: GlsB/YeaQ/YmgE family stress response membrane protein [Candidatus Limnocylindria bacterium]|nr:GlsB/YeaQ/YmgE family stress response membrane protein [Candidatus Limnocylindria bacterium]
MNILMWILFGALVGWIASLIMSTDEEQGALANIAVGIIGAFLGGVLARVFGGSGVTGFNLGSLLVAILGSVILLFFLRMINGRGHTV